MSEVFGTADQRAALRRGRSMAALLCDDPRFTYYGRTVGLVGPESGDTGQLAELARVQGNSNYARVTKDARDGIAADLTARGLVPVVYAKWEGRQDALRAAKAIVENRAVPEDLRLVELDGTTPRASCLAGEDGADLWRAADLRGRAAREDRPVTLRGSGRCDGRGRVLRRSVLFRASRPPNPGRAGLVGHAGHASGTTRARPFADARRARAILGMRERFGFADFMTGVEPGNAPSEAVCARMGLRPEGHSIIGCADPEALSSGRMTK